MSKSSKKGYVIARAEGSSFYVDDAEHIERDDSYYPFIYQDDEEAARAAEADGIKLIRGMPGVPDGVYVDTPETRDILRRHMGRTHETPASRAQSGCEQTSLFSPDKSKSPVRVASWKYRVLRFFMNRCRVAHEVLPLEGNILYVLLPCNINSLGPVVESLQKDCNVYVKMDSCEDSTLIAVMKEWEHAPAELAIKHRHLRLTCLEVQ